MLPHLIIDLVLDLLLALLDIGQLFICTLDSVRAIFLDHDELLLQFKHLVVE